MQQSMGVATLVVTSILRERFIARVNTAKVAKGTRLVLLH